MSLFRKHRIAYRPHIDGLRGVAVIAVVLYHAKLLAITGGFVGVDIFFVLSGFLIASIIMSDVRVGTFSLPHFWERRVRRILPIFFVVICCTAIAAYFLVLYPPDRLFFGKTVVAQSTFTSNVLYMVTDNYFDEQARNSPLLHTWSLAVEEQFYIFFPLIVIFCVWLGKFQKSNLPKIEGTHRLLFVAVALVCTLSFMMNVWFVNITPDALFKVKYIPDWIFGNATYATVGFYLPLTRAWELGLGVLIALSGVIIRSRMLAELLSIGGVIAIGVSLFFLTEKSAFPGIAALLPALGTGVFIVANEPRATIAGKLLSSTPLVSVGLISYSLYLWHWPLFVFAKLVSPTLPSPLTMAGLCVASLILSYLSYRYIEIPFRSKTFIKRRWVIFLMGTVALGILALLGTFFKLDSPQQNGKVPSPAQHILEAAKDNVLWGGVCFQLPGDESRYGGLCRIGDAKDAKKDTRQEFVVWGDSHAETMVPLFNTLGRAYGEQGIVFDSGNCPPIIGAHQIPPAPGCEEKKALALRYIREHDTKVVILIARWSYYISGGQNNKVAAMITDSNITSLSPDAAVKAFERTFVPMVEELAREGRSVYIVKQVPEQIHFDLRDMFYRAVRTNTEVQFTNVLMEESAQTQALPNSVVDSLATTRNVYVLEPAELLCAEGGDCKLTIDGRLMYRDQSHLSTFGAMSLESLFTPMFQNMRTNNVNGSIADH